MNHPMAIRDHSKAALALVPLLTDANGMVSVFHRSGTPTRWIQDGDVSRIDPESVVHMLSIPAADLQVREGVDNPFSGYRYLTYPSKGSWFNIIRARDGRLEAGDPRLPSWIN